MKRSRGYESRGSYAASRPRQNQNRSGNDDIDHGSHIEFDDADSAPTSKISHNKTHQTAHNEQEEDSETFCSPPGSPTVSGRDRLPDFSTEQRPTERDPRTQNHPGVELMDTDDQIDTKGQITWNYLKNKTSMKALSNHLRISTANDNAKLRKLKLMPAVKEPFDKYLEATRGSKHHWKPRQLVDFIKQDERTRRKLFEYCIDTQSFNTFEWTAYVLEKVKSAISKERDGPFFHKNRDETYLYTRAWSLIRYMRWDGSESRQHKRARQGRRSTESSPTRSPAPSTRPPNSGDARITGDPVITASSNVLVPNVEDQPEQSGHTNDDDDDEHDDDDDDHEDDDDVILPDILPAGYASTETVPITAVATNPSTTVDTIANADTTTTTTTTVTPTSIITVTTIVVVQKRPDLVG